MLRLQRSTGSIYVSSTSKIVSTLIVSVPEGGVSGCEGLSAGSMTDKSNLGTGLDGDVAPVGMRGFEGWPDSETCVVGA